MFISKVKNTYFTFEQGNLAFTVLLAISTLFMLSGYSFVRSASPSLFMADYGKDALPMALFWMSICLIPAIIIYNKLLSWLGVSLTYIVLNISSGMIMCVLAYAHSSGISATSYALFIIKDIYVMLIIEMVWSIFNSQVIKRDHIRLSGLLMCLNSVGLVVSSKITQIYSTSVGTVNFVYLTGAMAIPTAVFMLWALKLKNIEEIGIHKLQTDYKDKGKSSAEPNNKPDDPWGIRALVANPRLLVLFFIIIFAQVVATTTELRMQAKVYDVFLTIDEQTSYFGQFYFWLNLSAIIMQILGAPLFLLSSGIKMIQLSLPVLHTTLAISVLFIDDLTLIAVAAVLFKTFDYSLFRASKEVLYTSLDFTSRYRSKQLIDVFSYRFSKGASSLSVSATKSLFPVIGDGIYTSFALGASVMWFFLARKLMRIWKRSDDIKHE